ncbi:MAG: hypothetical protein K2G64_05695 [Muribaculaceae bacterium]|nr:hypothetical protein [Muribaculaceae bacterium]MDE5968580.1 hypothetical protein [Muribaculaceae bacterium]MDE7394273.1 hypothetical protein [Muribaculaceae bacterium]
MKKLLLSLAAVLSFGAMAYAENVTEVFNQTTFGEAGWPTSAATRPQEPGSYYTSPDTGIKYELYGCNVQAGYGGAADYLMMRNKETLGSYVSFSLGFDCQELILNTAGCSTGANNMVTIYAGTNVIVQNFKVNSQYAEFKVSIPQQYRAAGTKYKILSYDTGSSSNNTNQQFVSFTYVEQTSEASIAADVDAINFSVAKGGEQTMKFKALAENITDEIAISVDNEDFVVTPSTFTPVSGGKDIEVTFTGNVAGKTSAKLTLSYDDLKYEVALEAFVAAAEGTEASPLTPADVIAMKNLNVGPFCVKGTIYGQTAAGSNSSGLTFTDEEKNVKTNMVLEGEDGARIPVALPAAVRDDLNIVDNPDNVGKTVIVKGTLEVYFSFTGVKNTQLIELVGVESVAVDPDNAAAEYFNLQGVRVNEPANGLYIVRRGDKVSKEVVR